MSERSFYTYDGYRYVRISFGIAPADPYRPNVADLAMILRVMPISGLREDEDPIPIYDAYDDPDVRSRNIESYRVVLSELGLEVPESMFEAVAVDAREAFRNVSTEHFESAEVIRIRADLYSMRH
jgi:hypothetical protein